MRIATQFLIYEIVTGLRNADTFQQNGSNGYTDGDIFYNAGVDNVPYFAPHYNAIVESVQSAMKIPSFASRTSGTAPTITLTGEQTMVVDSNDVVSNFSFQDGNGAQFWTIGNQFYIQQTGNISASTVFKGTRYLPSADGSTFSVYYGGTSTYQTCVKLHSPSSTNLTAYFKLKAPAAGNLAIQKTTEDGKNLSGWQFGIYSNSSCTSLLSGPHTKNSTGKITVSGLTPGTVYKFCVSLQNSFAGDLTRIFAGAQGSTIGEIGGFVLSSVFSPPGSSEPFLKMLFFLLAFSYCAIKVFFANIKRGGILLIQIAVGSLYMFSVPRGYTDGFNQWCKQIAAICLTAFLQTTLLFLGSPSSIQ